MFNTKRAFKFLVVLAVIVFGVSFHHVHAIEYGMLGGKPTNPDPKVENSGAWFIYHLNAGEAKEDAVTVMNLFDTPLDVVIYAADSTPSSSGGFALKQESEPNIEVGSWVKFYPDPVPETFAAIFKKNDGNILEFCKLDHAALQKEYGKKTITDEQFADLYKWCQGTTEVDRQFQPKESINIPFVFAVPENADVGEHTGGILIQKKAADDQPGQQGSTVKLTTRVGVRIYETVPGEIVRKLSLDNFQLVKNFSEFSFTDWFGPKKPREYLIQSNISNSGNVSVEHDNNILVKDLLFHRGDQTIERKFQILKKDKFIANAGWSKPLFGYYSFQAQIKYQDSQGEEETLLSDPVKIWIIPWREITIALLLLLLLAAGYFGWRYYQKKKYGGIGWTKYTVKKNETVAGLAEKHKIDWRVLIKTNKLKAPYLLEAGQTILVPPAGKGKKTVKPTKKEIKTSAGEAVSVSMAPFVGAAENANVPAFEIQKPETAVKKSKNNQNGNKKVDALARLVRQEKKAALMTISGGWRKNKIFWAVGAILLIFLIVIVILITNNNRRNAQLEARIAELSAANLAIEKQKTAMPVSVLSSPAPEEKITAGEINIKILNEGAAAGLAGKVKTALAGEGYVKTEADNGATDKIVGNFIYYSADKFKAEAEKISEFLATRKIKAVVAVAETVEQKSADIVVILGK